MFKAIDCKNHIKISDIMNEYYEDKEKFDLLKLKNKIIKKRCPICLLNYLSARGELMLER